MAWTNMLLLALAVTFASAEERYQREVSESSSMFQIAKKIGDYENQLSAIVKSQSDSEARTDAAMDAVSKAIQLVGGVAPSIGRIDDLASSIGSLKGSVAAMSGSIDAKIASVAKSVSDSVDNAKKETSNSVSNLASKVDDLKKDVDKQLAGTLSTLKAEVDRLKKDLEDVEGSVDDELAKAGDKLTKQLSVVEAGITKKVNDAVKQMSVLEAGLTKKVNDAVKPVQGMSGVVNKMAQCGGTRQMYDKASNSCKTIIWERFWNNNWGGENGYVPNRRLTFTKWRDDTDLRITYHDNMRVHGHHWCRAAWYVEIDRSDCKDPGRISFDKYIHQQHNYWSNFHVGGGAHGVCRSNHKGRIRKGQHVIEVRVWTQRCDTYTGHNSQGGYLIVEEIVTEKRSN